MTRNALIPPALRSACAAADMSPGILSHAHVFLTGTTGVSADGIMPDTDAAQFEACFDKIASVLAEADLGLRSIVEMTSYHVGLRGHLRCLIGCCVRGLRHHILRGQLSKLPGCAVRALWSKYV